MLGDVIVVCDKCGGEDCRVEEIFPEPEKVSMGKYAQKRKFIMQRLVTSWMAQPEIKNRDWVITCQDCGFTYEFTEHRKPNEYLPTCSKDSKPTLQLIKE